MRKLKFLFKTAVWFSFLGALFLLFFLQEYSPLGNGFVLACREKGVTLPLQDPRIEVSVGGRTMTVFEGETQIRRYDIASGSSRRLGALDKDEASTPVGSYRIVRKTIRENVLIRGSRFLQIDYPNLDDADRAWDLGRLDRGEYDRIAVAQNAGTPPPTDTKVGGPLGIQGNYFLFLGSSFTDGSIAMSNGDIVDLFDHIPVGTPVVIKP